VRGRRHGERDHRRAAHLIASPALDDLGDLLPLSGPPRSIVSLVPSLTELVAEWGHADALVGVTDYCISPHDAFPHADRIRGTKNPDIGRIIARRPDLVLADQEENRRIDVDRLRAAGIAVWVTRVRSVREVAASVRRLGPVLGSREAGDDLAHRILAELEAPPSAGQDAGQQGDVPSVCMIWRDGPQHGVEERWWAVGPDTFAGDLLRSAGLPPVPLGDDGRYPRATLAQVRAAQPRVVLLPDEPYEFGDEDAQVFDTWPVDVLRCSGQPLFWWGPRTPGALRWLRGVRDANDQNRVRRSDSRRA
jgi:ABC-type Fe3+-hydroxamate transport system substrate-binding protein